MKNKGITLIALTVTVIVLLIISGVTISYLTGENGIINQAKDSKKFAGAVEEKEVLNTSVAAAIGKSSNSKIDEVNDFLMQDVYEKCNFDDVVNELIAIFNDEEKTDAEQ